MASPQPSKLEDVDANEVVSPRHNGNCVSLRLHCKVERELMESNRKTRLLEVQLEESQEMRTYHEGVAKAVLDRRIEHKNVHRYINRQNAPLREDITSLRLRNEQLLGRSNHYKTKRGVRRNREHNLIQVIIRLRTKLACFQCCPDAEADDIDLPPSYADSDTDSVGGEANTWLNIERDPMFRDSNDSGSDGSGKTLKYQQGESSEPVRDKQSAPAEVQAASPRLSFKDGKEDEEEDGKTLRYSISPTRSDPPSPAPPSPALEPAAGGPGL